MDVRQAVLEGQGDVPRVGAVVSGLAPSLPFVVQDKWGREVKPVSEFLRDLVIGDATAATCYSYAQSLLRWFRLLWLLDRSWEQATRDDVTVLVGWLRTARNPQRRRSPSSQRAAGQVNIKTGKPSLSEGYAPATINHTLSVISGFYSFHAQFCRGPVVNPVPQNAERRRLLAHRSPLDPPVHLRRADLRQRIAVRQPRSIPDGLWDELFTVMTCDRDRALLAFYVSSGARASELLGLTMERVDWAGQRIWVVSKGSHALEAIPASPQAFQYLVRYLDQHGQPKPGEPLWRALRGAERTLSYAAMRRVLQRANDKLGTNWTLHDLRHTAATRMAADPRLTLVEVQTVLRHRHLSTTERYLQPRLDEVIDKLRDHYARPRPQRSFAAGYGTADIATVFGG